MKPLALAILLVFTGFLPQLTSAQSANVTFKATLKSDDNSSLSNVYARIFSPGNPSAIDSLFTNTQGFIEIQLPFSWTGTGVDPVLAAASSIVEPMTPNVISASTTNTRLTYAYPASARLYFSDLQGKRHVNGAMLPSGFYFYYLSFSDGTRSNMQKMLLTEPCRVNVTLNNNYINPPGSHQPGPGSVYGGEKSSTGERISARSSRHLYPAGGGTFRKEAAQDQFFYVEFIRDGYMTLWDTIYIDSDRIERTYTMQHAPLPTASFSWSGELLTGQPVVFDATGSSGAEGEPVVCSWDFGDGKKGQSEQLPHIFVAPGTYDIQLTVTGNYGAKHMVSHSVTIAAGHEATQFDGNVIAVISDLDGMDLKNAAITVVEDEQQVYTDQRGIAVVENLPVGIPLHFRITAEGYVTQVAEVTIPESTAEAVFFASMKERSAAATLGNVEFGGKVTGTDGAAFSLPVDALVKEDGSAVKGDVQISITPVDVAYDAAAFPGSFVGYTREGEDGVLLSYGVAEFHLEQAGEQLQLGAGKKAVIEIPVYTSGASAGDEIPLWSVDEESGTWVEEGAGTVIASNNSPTGLAFRAEIGHLSWWNCDDWEDEKRRDGLCYRLECTSAICVRMKVGCWVSGAMRDKKKSTIMQVQAAGGNAPEADRKGLTQATAQDVTGWDREVLALSVSGPLDVQNTVEREDILPVFEVREFIPETGKNLRFPTSRDVLVDARAFGPGNQLLGGRYIVEGDNPSDSFAIELTPLAAGDTFDLALNSIEEQYLGPGEVSIYHVEIPVAGEYRIYAEPGTSPRLNGIFNVFQAGTSLLTGDIGSQEHWIDALPGSLYISIAGQQSDSEGNYVIGISERNPMMAGDTLSLALNEPVEEFLDAATCKHFRVNIPTAGLYRVDLNYGSYPALYGRFEVHGTGPYHYHFLTTDDHGYIFAEAGEYILSVAGLDLKSKGNFVLGIWEINAEPVALNDSLYVNMPETDQFHMYSLQTGSNTLLDCRFYQVGSPFVSGRVTLLSPTGNILKEGNLYTPGARIVSPLASDSVYYLEVERINNTFDYVIIPAEEAPVPAAYGDTLENRLRFNGDKDMYHFDGHAGEVISVRGYQPDYQLSRGYFSLLDAAGNTIGTRDISYSDRNNDYEIVYMLPETGRYSIIVGSHQDDTGSYQVLLNEITPTDLGMNNLTELEVGNDTSYYAWFDLPDSHLIHFSILSDNGSGSFELWDAGGNRLTTASSNRVIYNFYNASYTGIVKEGPCFVRINNDNANLLYVNIAGAQPLSFDAKGKATFIDTIQQPHHIKAYALEGQHGDGIHGILKRNAGATAPEKAELRYFRMSAAGGSLYLASKQADYRALDDSYLHESGIRLGGEAEDTVFVVVATGSTAGTFHFELHHVRAADDILVDDDFVQYPDAPTSSHIAAGYAVRELGSVTLADGEYTSMLPMKIEADYVTFTGQDEAQVELRNVYNASDNPVVYFYSASGYIGNLTLSCGTSNYYAIESLYGGITMDHLHIKPLEGSSRVAGGIKGGGDGLTLSNITMTNSVWGIQLGSSGAVIEDCDLLTENRAIECNGDNIVIRNNQIEVTVSNRAIVTRAAYATSGTQLIEGNTIRMTMEGYSDGSGIINVENFTRPADMTSTVVRNNTIYAAGNNAAFSLTLGNPPSTITVENNSYYGTGPEGGKALMMQAGRLDGVSSMFIRNNTFSGLQAAGNIVVYGSEYINADQRFAIYNNSFRLAAGATAEAGDCFTEARASGYSFTDTARIYLVNNIFQGNGEGSFLKCSDDFSVYADYNTVYHFSSYLGDKGKIIGMSHDVTDDPLYLDDDLHLDPASPAVDKGAGPDLFPGIPVKDKEGTARPQGGGFDMGAYER